MADLLPIDEALARVLERVRPLQAEAVVLRDAAGRVLADPASAPLDLPPFRSSAMDGFAVSSADVPGRLPVVFRIAAGHPAPGPLTRGTAMAIATGGAVPDGADAVVPLEYVVDHDNNVEIPEVTPGANVRPRGSDVRQGDSVVPAGTRLGPAQLGALAAAGIGEVRCFARPRVAVLATGSELREPGAALEDGEIYEANGVMLAAALAGAGALAEQLPPVEDDAAAHRAALTRALTSDVVVTSGGVSVGPHDLVRTVGTELGVEEVFWGVAAKPGKPFWFGVRGGTLVFGLPGNPVSALVGFELFVRPAVAALQGIGDSRPRFESGVLARAVKRDSARDQLVRATRTAEGDAVVLEPLTGQESHMIVRAAAADALVLVPSGDGELADGSRVRYLPLP